MSKIEYVGRMSGWLGRSLPQICLKLKDFGVGRIVVRHNLVKRYKEACYYVLTKVEPDMSDQFLRLGSFQARVVFRGGDHGIMDLEGNIEDYQLVPKEDEKYFLERTLPPGQRWRKPTVVPKFVDLPPTLKEMIMDECNEKNVKFSADELKLPYIIKTDSVFTIAVQQ